MQRESDFLISRKPYAVDLKSLRLTTKNGADGRPYYSGRINAVWFRRKGGVTSAHVGTLWDSQHEQPANGQQFLASHQDGRYAGDCDGRWDGERYWGASTPTRSPSTLTCSVPCSPGTRPSQTATTAGGRSSPPDPRPGRPVTLRAGHPEPTETGDHDDHRRRTVRRRARWQ